VNARVLQNWLDPFGRKRPSIYFVTSREGGTTASQLLRRRITTRIKGSDQFTKPPLPQQDCCWRRRRLSPSSCSVDAGGEAHIAQPQSRLRGCPHRSFEHNDRQRPRPSRSTYLQYRILRLELNTGASTSAIAEEHVREKRCSWCQSSWVRPCHASCFVPHAIQGGT